MDIVKSHVEKLYNGKCNIFLYENKQNSLGIDTTEKRLIYENIPCRLSFQSFPYSSQTETVDLLTQSVKLFLSPDIEVKAGSEIEVIQNGKKEIYNCSSQPAVYISHQEILVSLKGRWT